MKRVWLVGVFLLLVGCMKDVDFNQVDDIEIKSVYIASLAYFDLVAEDFLDEDLNELAHIEDFILTRLKSDYADNVEKLEFTFVFSNSFSRDFIATVIFLDADGNLLYLMEPSIEISRNTENVKTVITVEQPDIETIYSASRAGFFIQLLSDGNNVLTPQSQGILNLKSSLTLYLNVKK